MNSFVNSKSRRASLPVGFFTIYIKEISPTPSKSLLGHLCVSLPAHALIIQVPHENHVLRFGSFCQFFEEVLIHLFFLVWYLTEGVHHDAHAPYCSALSSHLSFTQRLSQGLLSTLYCTSKHIYNSFIYRETPIPFLSCLSFLNKLHASIIVLPSCELSHHVFVVWPHHNSSIPPIYFPYFSH